LGKGRRSTETSDRTSREGSLAKFTKEISTGTDRPTPAEGKAVAEWCSEEAKGNLGKVARGIVKRGGFPSRCAAGGMKGPPRVGRETETVNNDWSEDQKGAGRL